MSIVRFNAVAVVKEFLRCSILPFARLESSTSVIFGPALDWIKVANRLLAVHESRLNGPEKTFVRELCADLADVKALNLAAATSEMPRQEFNHHASVLRVQRLPVLESSANPRGPDLFVTVAPMARIADSLLNDISASNGANCPIIASTGHLHAVEQYVLQAVSTKFGGHLNITTQANAQAAGAGNLEDMDVDEGAMAAGPANEQEDRVDAVSTASEGEDGELDDGDFNQSRGSASNEHKVPAESRVATRSCFRAAVPALQFHAASPSAAATAAGSAASVPRRRPKRIREDDDDDGDLAGQHAASSSASNSASSSASSDSAAASSNGQSLVFANAQDSNFDVDDWLTAPHARRQVRRKLNEIALLIKDDFNSNLRQKQHELEAMQREVVVKTQRLAAASEEIARLNAQLAAVPSLQKRNELLQEKLSLLSRFVRLDNTRVAESSSARTGSGTSLEDNSHLAPSSQ